MYVSLTRTELGELSSCMPIRLPTKRLSSAVVPSMSLRPTPYPLGPRLRAKTLRRRARFELYMRKAPTELPSRWFSSITLPSLYMKCRP